MTDFVKKPDRDLGQLTRDLAIGGTLLLLGSSAAAGVVYEASLITEYLVEETKNPISAGFVVLSHLPVFTIPLAFAAYGMARVTNYEIADDN